jgi:tRNA pseudouridine38-40 synthase
MRIALGLEYDGHAFCGWQRQANQPSVQAVLEKALAAIAGVSFDGGGVLPVTAAGRTDTGVHATLQVVHFDSDSPRPLNAWVRGTNAHLPSTVAVRWAVPVADDFHARFSAVSRHYVYWLLNRDARPGINAGRVGWTHRPLDADAMHSAAQALVGTHDFSTFRAAECQAKTPVKTMHRLRVQRLGPYVRIDVHANAFLHHMVRNIVGALVFVGDGRITRAQFETLFHEKNRALAPPTFAAQGLYLCGIEYPPAYRIPETFCDTTP